MNIRYIVLLVILLAACSDKTSVFEAKKDLNKQIWHIDSATVFEFEIQDILTPYTIDYTLRYGLSYRYCNIYINYELQNDAGKTLKNSMLEAELVNCKTGKPLGAGGAGFYDTQQSILKSHQFKKTGKYRLRLTHYMRTDTLKNIIAVGAKINKLVK